MTQKPPSHPGEEHPDSTLMAPAYEVVVNGRPVEVHGARSCQAPWPFRCFKAGEHPDIRLASPDAPAGVAQVGPAGNAPYAFAGFDLDGPATIEVTVPVPCDEVAVRPAGLATHSLEGNPLTLRLDRPAKLSIASRLASGASCTWCACATKGPPSPTRALRPSPSTPGKRAWWRGARSV